jgi:hypothetical protein
MSLWLNLSREDDGTLPYENEQVIHIAYINRSDAVNVYF